MNKIRNADGAVEIIRTHFHFLFNKGFLIANKVFDGQSFGNWIVVLHSKVLLVRFIQDRGDVDIEIGPPWESTAVNSTGHFLELRLLIDYINKRSLTVLTPPVPRDIDDQLSNLSSMLATNIEEIISFFNAEDYLQKEKEIKALRLNILKQMYPYGKYPDVK
jgi:hypothetical protein